MRLTVLGSGTIYPNKNRGISSYFVTIGNKNILLDIGPGTISRLPKININFPDLDIIVISHLHTDHINDIFYLITLFNLFIPKKEITIISSPGFKEFLVKTGETYKTASLSSDVLKKLRFIDAPSFSTGVLNFELKKGNHHLTSIITKIKDNEGREIVYTSDTSFDESIASFTKNPDLLITECTFPDNQPQNDHLTPSSAAKLGSIVGAKRMLLGHLGPNIRNSDLVWEISQNFQGRLYIAEDFMNVSF